MRKVMILGLFIAVAFLAKAQGKTLYEANIVTPKAGMTSTFETKWKAHLDMYHKNSDKRSVYEIVSGPQSGSFVIVEGPFTYASMDTSLTNAKEHRLDLEKNFSPYIEPESENFIARWADTLSYNGARTDKSLLTITTVKDGKLAEVLTEMRRTTLVSQKLKSPFSNTVLIKQQAGSSPMIINIRNLKEGYRELETNYFNLPTDGFKNAYISDYGQAAWDKRLLVLVDNIVSREQHFEIFRADLSSK